jgi:hypothetical protein
MVGTFADLGYINSPSYGRRVSILDYVARVKCCMLMLDLGLDHLILDIFHHIFKAASYETYPRFILYGVSSFLLTLNAIF